MDVAFPIQEDLGLDSPVHNHFGSAKMFIIVESESLKVETIENQDLGHSHGQCNPLKAMGQRQVDAAVVGGIGKGALIKLSQSGIKTFRSVGGTIKDNIELMTAGKLTEFSLDMTCAGHGPKGQCIH